MRAWRSEDGKSGGRIPKWAGGDIRQNAESKLVSFYFGHRGEAFKALSEFSLSRALQNEAIFAGM
jgi:hypothetical protein